MKHLCTFVIAAMFWALAATVGFPAESAVRCKLELVRLEPLDLDKSDESIVYHAVSSQRFIRRSGKGILWGPTFDPEKNFQQLVKKEPAKYLSDRPFRSVAKLGSKEFAFVLDKKDERSKGYDRLYFDLNGNGDLTDDKPVDAVADKGFPRVDLAIDIDGKKLDYAFFLVADSHREPDYEITRAWLSSAVYRRGEITLDGKKHKIAVLDWNGNGRFDDVLSLPRNPHGDEGQICPVYGDILLIDPGKLAARDDLDSDYPLGDERQFLGKVTVFGDKCHEVKVSPLGDEVVWKQPTAARGQVAAPYAPCHVNLISDIGYFRLNFEKRRTAVLPVGQWWLLSYDLTIESWKEPEPPLSDRSKQKPPENPGAKPEPLRGPAKPPQIWAAGTWKNQPVIVRADRTAILKLGPPYRATVKVDRKREIANFTFVIRGADGEVVTGLRASGKSPERPKITISDPQGKVVAEGAFEYG
jgi:hypothetical protein